MSKLLTTASTVAVLALAPAAAQSAGTRHCPYRTSNVGNVTASKTTCAKAKKVVQAEMKGKHYGGFRCHSKAHTAGATVTCRKGQAKVVWQIAD
ncbi:MAG TPA: hypothetical protein VGN69_08345 [Solirubrobacteraceae bacterium]|jgi:hypothetical protein|nr:hypothetical protein [Solirubrobacteraceae bacterium]